MEPVRSCGTRRVADEQETAQRVRELFTHIVPRYDLLNHLLSLSFDRLWRWRTARRLLPVLSAGDRVLDVCCGTGDLTFALEAATVVAPVHFWGVDFVPDMLERARRKAARRGSHARWVAADALQLPFPDGQFAVVMLAFGFRNLASYPRGLAEFHRVLRPGGWLAILDFAEPGPTLFGRLYRFYFRRILPVLGGLISGDFHAYRYLPESVARFPDPERLARMVTAAGFHSVQLERWTGGAVWLMRAQRAPAGSRDDAGQSTA